MGSGSRDANVNEQWRSSEPLASTERLGEAIAELAARRHPATYELLFLRIIARDTKLNRDVALKVLPDSFASDPDRLARFSREAQTLAAAGVQSRGEMLAMPDGEIGKSLSVNS